MRKIALILALTFLLPGLVQAKSLEDLLVEKGVITKSEARGAMDAGSAKVYWNNGTRVELPDSGFTAKINTMVRTSYVFTDNDSDSGARDTSSFNIDNVRLWVTGTALHNEFDYMLKADFATATRLLDAWLRWHPCDCGWVRMGQFKTPISRQFVTSVGKLQFANRTAVSNFFSLGRQQGADFALHTDDNMFSLGAGVFNGSSVGEGINSAGVDNKHTWTVHARFNAMGNMDPYSEGDVEYTEDAAVSIGAAYAFSDGDSFLGAGGSDETHSFSADLNVKASGFSLQGEFYFASLSSDTLPDSDPLGFYVQAGYFVEPSKWEVAARYGFLDCDDSGAGICAGNNDVTQVSVSINHYWWNHNIKAQLGYDLIAEDALVGSDINTNRWMLQLSSWF